MYTMCGSSYAKIEQGEVAVTDQLLTIHLVCLSVDSTRSLCAKLAASMHDGHYFHGKDYVHTHTVTDLKCFTAPSELIGQHCSTGQIL